MLRIYCSYAESNLRMTVVRYISWVLHDVSFSLVHVLKTDGFEMTLLAERTSESGAISKISEQAIHRLS